LSLHRKQTQQAEALPEKYQGKSAAELARMHQEAEKLLGRQSSEVGELRKVVDSYIQTQLSQQQAPQKSDDEDYDFFTDPDKAVSRAIENHPKIKEAETVHSTVQESLGFKSASEQTPRHGSDP
jgi:hypothetical protein